MKSHVRARKGQSCRSASLKRLPGDFSWQLLGLLLGSLRNEASDGLVVKLEEVLRKRDSIGYHGLRDTWGLQCIPHVYESSYTPKACVDNLLVNVLKKHYNLETKSAAERRKAVVEGVVREDELLLKVQPTEDKVLESAKRFIAQVLGDAPDVDQLTTGVKHGPGVAIGVERDQESAYFKYSLWPYHVSPAARGLLREVITKDVRWLGALEDSYRRREAVPMWRVLDWDTFWDKTLVPCPFNRVTSVPKDGTKDRPIAVEPVGNVYLQLGVERVIRKRLRDHGLDLDDQAPNQRLAHLGSLMDSPLGPVTLDLSNASDTISRDLVRRLLPSDWFALLDAIRSPWGELPDGTYLRYAKMSSMGNGTTFVLETLVFYALLVSISSLYGDWSDRSCIRAYGDDLVFPKYLYPHVCAYLGNWGFKVNHSKSFAAGPVRESCGADYYLGYNIRPVFLKEDEPSDIASLVGFRNRLKRWFVLRLGVEIPACVDNFFLKFIHLPELMPRGPESNVEFDSYWHTPCPSEFVRCVVWTRKAVRLPAREFLFRKLMHNLLGIGTSSEGRFDVNAKRAGTLRTSSRVVYNSHYWEYGQPIQDHVRPRYEGYEIPEPLG